MANEKLIRWCETEELKSLSILNRENDVGNVKISLMEMKSFVLPAKKGIERLVGEKKGKTSGLRSRRGNAPSGTKSRMNENGSSFWGEQSKIYLMIYLSK